jgi:rhodanese-related sulfurtransferase
MTPDFRRADLETAASELPPDALLVDIREPYEWNAGRIPGSIHVPIDEVAEWVTDAPPERTLVFVCLGGRRAAMVARACAGVGLSARYLADGMRGWVSAGGSLDPETGHLADHGRSPG